MGETKRSTVSLIYELLTQVVEKARTAEHSKTRCHDLASHLKVTLRDVLPHYKAAKDEATRKQLRRLRAAVDDALVLVKSCQASFPGYSHSATKAGIESVRARVKACLQELARVDDAKLLRQVEQHAAAAAATAAACDKLSKLVI